MSKLCRKVCAIFIAVVFLILTCYYAGYISTHMVHECSGIHCAVCYELNMAEVITKQISVAAMFIGSCYFYVIYLNQFGIISTKPKKLTSLVSLKVRLDD